MKHISTIVNTILAIVMILFLLSTGLPNFTARAAKQADITPTPTVTVKPTQEPEVTCNKDRSINVTGTAVVNVVPDRALIQLGVQSNGRTPKEVQARNTAMISRVVKALKGMGVEARDISTDRYVIQPLYEDWDSLRIKGYRIFNVISITMRDVDKTSEAIAAAFQAGANQVVNVEFYTSDLRKYRDQAREMAMTAAREKAGDLAKAAGSETGCVLNINENSWSYFNGWSGWGWWYNGGNTQNVWTQNAVQSVPAGNSASGDGTSSNGDSPVNAGQISIRAEVSATFSLK
ncbi:MAG TPA: SIMPL domain-containing protein [Anaerolineales bacterium]|nr:SIMPL domain-containing protein [Anaerolineales bacterium]